MRAKTVLLTAVAGILACSLLWLLPSGHDQTTAKGGVYIMDQDNFKFHGLPTVLADDVFGEPGIPVCVETPDGRETCVPIRGMDPARVSEETLKTAIKVAAKRGLARLNETAEIDLSFDIVQPALAQPHCEDDCGGGCSICCFAGSWVGGPLNHCMQCGLPFSCTKCWVYCPPDTCHIVCPG